MQMTDNELTVKCMNVLMDSVGPVDAERFVSIVNLNHFDYTEWRKDHLFVGETVDKLVDKIRAFESEDSLAFQKNMSKGGAYGRRQQVA